MQATNLHRADRGNRIGSMFEAVSLFQQDPKQQTLLIEKSARAKGNETLRKTNNDSITSHKKFATGKLKEVSGVDLFFLDKKETTKKDL